MTPTITAVVCTWNRATLLDGALEALVRQTAAPPHDVLVVDNGSTDETRSVVERWASRHRQVVYVHEPQPGLSCARNAAIRRARSPLIAFTDDDVRVGPEWIARVAAAFERWPEAACVGGPVIPEWPEQVPRWLTPRQWAPLGVQDYGSRAVRVDPANPLCLIGANLAFRRSAIEAVGYFNSQVQRVGDGAGSTEDHELHLRLWAAGRHGMYDPDLAVRAIVLPERLRKSHHRTWQFGHGRHIARMRIPEIEATTAGRVLGVPAHLVRQAAADAFGWAASLLRGDAVGAFEREAHLWFIAGFIRERSA